MEGCNPVTMSALFVGHWYSFTCSCLILVYRSWLFSISFFRVKAIKFPIYSDLFKRSFACPTLSSTASFSALVIFGELDLMKVLKHTHTIPNPVTMVHAANLLSSWLLESPILASWTLRISVWKPLALPYLVPKCVKRIFLELVARDERCAFGDLIPHWRFSVSYANISFFFSGKYWVQLIRR